ncbi:MULTISPECIES: PAS domain S-box protein [Pontibacillus]|uniref:histidine kinase n=1 Tax=Pontibacillus chungwhensis TaxID=265426 RepID=A0ABY8US02_9BACI|nr:MULTISPECIES: PAS domain S-box protein [Pontibacillus]MCD5322880.1 PAS domain S-box protein [Pontibacillus sp. HN14]WIF96277.1 PAS domain S-box protein [Pontibacillus chungwhensis]
MESMLASYSPILFLIAILLTLMTSYTALDLFTLYKTSERNGQFLFIGGMISMGIGIWVMNFLTMLSSDSYNVMNNQVPLTILSVGLGITFAGIAFYFVTNHSEKVMYLFLGSFFLTMGVFATHVTGMYTLKSSVYYQPFILSWSLILLYGSFLLALWILFYYKNLIYSKNPWLKPISSIIITGAIVEGYFLLSKSVSFEEAVITNGLPVTGNHSFSVYFLLFMSVLIIAGVLVSSTLLNTRLASKDTYVRDITFALDQSSIVAITDSKGIITYVNQKFCEISGYKEDELIGQDHSLISSGYHSKDFFKELWKTIGTGQVWKGEIKNQAKDGSYYWVDTTIVPFLNAKGKPYQYIAIRSNITTRKEAEHQLRNALKEVQDIEFALNQSTIVAITDEKGKIKTVNDKFCEISGYTRGELIGEDHRILNSSYHPSQFFKQLWKSIGTGHVWRGEIRNKKKDGTFYWVDTTIIPFMNESGKPYQYLSIRNDITERKKTEEVLHRQDKLAAVGQLAAGVAHEIRNPLTSMRGYAEYLQLDEEDLNRRDLLDIIVDEIERVNVIVEEFMVLSKPRAVHLEEKRITPIIQNVLSLLNYQARKNKVSLQFQEPNESPLLHCDEDRLKQVFLNLVKNGIEANEPGGEVTIFMESSDEFLTIYVRDTGEGIPEHQLKQLGEPFYTTKENGNGLGLMMTYKIIESHNGSIRVESKKGQGTTFIVSLPVLREN